jgi:SAM-dependent methyltransferase
MRDQIIGDYATLEPEGTDAWNPLLVDMQLGYRLALLYGLCRAINLSGQPPSDLDVVDIGCGNGRSTRAYLEFGLQPEQLCGLDFRPGAISMARHMHPSIRYEVQGAGALPFADQSVNWVSLCMVVSSIRSPEHRHGLLREIQRVLRPGGHLFYLDHPSAADFAGGGRLDVDGLFAPLTCLWQKQLRLMDVLADANLPPSGPAGQRKSFRIRFGKGRGPLSWIPRPDGLGPSLKARLPQDLARWLSREPPAFEIRFMTNQGPAPTVP